MRVSTMSSVYETGKKRRFFFTDGHGEHRGRWLRELWGGERKWVSCSTSLPIQVMPREGVEDGVADSIEKYILVFHKDDEQITVEDALREAGASLEFPKPAGDLGCP